MIRKKLLLLIFVIFISGCATLFSEKTDKITIKTDPPGAEIYDGAELLGSTPFVHTFKRDTFHHKKLKIKKDGYQTHELKLGRQLDKIALFNIGFILTTAGASSWATDAFSGAMIEYEPKSYFLDLQLNNQQKSSSKYHIDLNPVIFSLLNHDSLLRDISRGNGAYLSAYHNAFSTNNYESFLENIKQHEGYLINQKDGVEFARYLKTYVR